MHKFIVLGCVLAATAGFAHAADVAIVPTRLVVVDTTAAGGTAKVLFVANDASVTKGAGTDATAISATIRIAYDDAASEFVMPEGAAWSKNTDVVAKYLQPRCRPRVPSSCI
jgi:hypothetical protein